MPSRGLPEVPRGAICDWYQRKYGQRFDPEGEAVVTLGGRRASRTLAGDRRPRGRGPLAGSLLSDTSLRRDHSPGGTPVPVSTGPGRDAYAEIEARWGARPSKPRGLIVNFPHNPTSAVTDVAFYDKVVALAKREEMWVISDLAYADLMHDGRQAPSIFQVRPRATSPSRCSRVFEELFDARWRVGFCVGNRELVGALTSIKGYLDYGMFRAHAARGGTALASCDADVVANRERYRIGPVCW